MSGKIEDIGQEAADIEVVEGDVEVGRSQGGDGGEDVAVVDIEGDGGSEDIVEEVEGDELDEGQSGEDNEDGLPQRNFSEKYRRLVGDKAVRTKLTGLYKEWFLDYASYVILERAVPHLEDGLKPVQRRILHSMRRIEDGRYNKVANIVGQSMQFHPHGDASISDALVQLGQKDLLIDCQGNWGNILTGDGAAAGRYIEARLTKFALDVVFNPKTTEWMLSYDGRNQEPVTLPVKFPLLLAQGVEGIAVGLASKILPHNFNELIDASIAYLKEEEFVLYPDFITGGYMDCARYNDGLRGGAIKVRARIQKVDNRTLAITEIPFGTTTEGIKESIVKANEKGKIKIKKVEDNTAAQVEIIVHVSNDESADKTIDALYAFTSCEVSISPNSCVIYDNKPVFLGVCEILKRSADTTKDLLEKELQIRLNELAQQWHSNSLEKIFIENKLYQLMEECKSREEAYEVIGGALEPFKELLRQEIVHEDVVKLTELKFIRITRYDSEKADRDIKGIEKEIKETNKYLAQLVDYTIDYYVKIKEKYGKGRERKTEIKEFDSIESAKVAVANAKLYVDRAGGFFGIGGAMKQYDYVCDCSDLDEVIVFAEDGRYIITKVSDKAFFAPKISYIGVFMRNDERTIYNVLYSDGEKGNVMMKRCAIKGVTRDKEYDITKGTPKSKILYMSVNPNGEAEILKVMFRQRVKLKKPIVDLDFSTLAIKGRQSQGNIFSRYAIHKILLKSKGTSTLVGQNIWYEESVKRLNVDGRGSLLGVFEGNDKIIVFTAKNQYYITGYDVGQHFPEDTVKVEKYDSKRVYSVVYWDGEQGYYYVKRFVAEMSDKMQSFMDENTSSKVVCMESFDKPILEVIFGGTHSTRPIDVVDVKEFIGVKGHKAKGKRLTTYEVSKLRFVPQVLPPSGGDGPQPIDEIDSVDEVEEEKPFDFEPIMESRSELVTDKKEAVIEVKKVKGNTIKEAIKEGKTLERFEQDMVEEFRQERLEEASVKKVLPKEEVLSIKKALAELSSTNIDEEQPEDEFLEPVSTDNVEMEIIIPEDDDEDSRNPKIKQLNLF